MSPVWPCLLSFTCLVLSGLGEDYQTGGEGQCERPAGEGMIRADRPYYSAGDTLTVQCETGYRPSLEKITCTRGQPNDTWDHSPWCIGQCELPAGGRITQARTRYYNAGESLTVKCETGYRPSHKAINCIAGQTKDTWDRSPSCIGRCKSPAGEGMIRAGRPYYSVGDALAVQCETGYRPSHEKITCTRGQTDDTWDHSPWCIERCKGPSISNLETVTPNREYYNRNEKVTLQCKPGYYPSPYTIYCTNNGERDVWTPAAVCIERCKEPSISNLETVTPYREYYNRYEGVTLQCKPGYYPSSNTIYCTNNGERDVWMPAAVCIVPNLPHIVKGPSMEDGRMRWSLLNRQGIVTGYKVEIVARRDYDPSFSGNESHWLPPNVTECEILLQRGTNYTVTIRAMTSSGDGRSAVYMIETPPGGGRSNLTGPSDSNTSLDLASMLWLTVPILTVKLLILVVLLKIQFTLMAGKSPESDLVRHEELGNWILYRKREEGIVIL